jgi:hypothetical protein
VVACELDNNVEVEVMVDKATIACAVFSNVLGCFCPLHHEEFVEEIYVLVQALEE